MSTLPKRRAAPFAPWAEIVPGYGPVTVDLLPTMPDDGYVYEVVEGVLVRMAGSGFNATTLGLELAAELRNYVLPRRLGRVTGADGVYKFPGAETGLLPDVGFVAAAKVAVIADRRRPIPFAPDLAVEVASPDQTPDAMAAKARTYLDGGTRLVWVIWPDRQQIEVWHAGRSVGPATMLSMDDTLEGEDVIPGFMHPVAAVFADPLA
jgi:Uma2 family endonuclease